MRFYVSPDSIFPDKNLIEIKDRTEMHHMKDVMRLEKGDKVDVFNGQGMEFSCVIEEIRKDAVIIRIEDKVETRHSPCFKVTLYQALPKKTKMDFIIEKTVELGVDKIVPVASDRTVPDIKDSSKKIERWKRIAMASSKQCGRQTLPSISNVMDFDSALQDSKENGLVIFASLDKESRPLKAILDGSRPKNIAVFIGPEGDFSQREVSLARDAKFSMCSLGKLVLKSETAAIYVLSCLSYEFQA